MDFILFWYGMSTCQLPSYDNEAISGGLQHEEDIPATHSYAHVSKE